MTKRSTFVLAIALALAGCETTPMQEQTEETITGTVQADETVTATVQAEETAGETAQADETAPTQTGTVLDWAGRWEGRWGGQSKSSLTVTGDTPEDVEIEYCFRGECWNVSGYTFENGTLMWEPRNSRFTFVRAGERLKGKLHRGGKTYAVTMRRQ